MLFYTVRKTPHFYELRNIKKGEKKMKFLAILVVVGLFACSLIGCGGGESIVPVNPDAPIPLTASAVKPDRGETVSRYTWVEIVPPDPTLEYGVGVADQDGGIPYGTWSVSIDHGIANDLAPGDFHIPKGATYILFVAHNGWVGRLDPGKTFTVVLFAEKNGIVDPRVDWQWTFTVDPSRPFDCGELGANCG